jgi:iron complex outermembrane receptor protein
MIMIKYFKFVSAGAVCAMILITSGFAENFNIPGGDLKAALNSFAKQTGVSLIVSGEAIKGVQSRGAKGDFSSDDALSLILSGTGFVIHHHSASAITIVRDTPQADDSSLVHVAVATASTVSGASLETVTVTSSKIGGDVQNIPIAITALSQEQLTATQTTGGPDLVKQVPNMTFTKTNFTGYSIQLRGIGTQAISVTTDPAVAVAFNDVPFLRNHFFEQEFYDVGQVEVLRGPQGTLYGRNATAGVVNLSSAKPTDEFEAMASADVGNYGSFRGEGMINVPIVDDRLDLRIAGELTKRNGYTFDETTNQSVDGRFLWSTRVTLGWKPVESVQTYLVWEHFNENDDRERSSKQLCKRDPGPDSLNTTLPDGSTLDISDLTFAAHSFLSQGCLPTSLYSPDAFETPNGAALPIVFATQFGNGTSPFVRRGIDPYASVTQSPNLRVIQSELKPVYKARNDIIEFNADYKLTPAITFTSQTAYNSDQLHSAEDFNRFNSQPDIFFSSANQYGQDGQVAILFTPNGVLCDPQLGCSNKFVGEDLSQEHAWQFSQEFRFTSNFDGPVNFSVGANYLHYETEEDYYVFLNLITLESRFLDLGALNSNGLCDGAPEPHTFPTVGNAQLFFECPYTDPSSISQLMQTGGGGHNYFRSINPYLLDSYAGFGEVNYQPASDLKFTGGLRWTDDQKHFTQIPSEVLIPKWGYPIEGVVNQQWEEFTGRFVANWIPKLNFTDQTLIYGSYSRGYKAGGANPPGPNTLAIGNVGTGGILGSELSEIDHPLTFKPEFVNAYELGTKNTLLDGALTLNGDVFYYDYKNYQISEIVDRTSINLNFNTNVRGAELEATWEPLPGLRFNVAGGYEDSRLAKGDTAIDLIDRTAGTPGWIVIKPVITATSNCIIPAYVVAEFIVNNRAFSVTYPSDVDPDTTSSQLNVTNICTDAYTEGLDPVAAEFGNDFTCVHNPGQCPYLASGFDPKTAPNSGAGFSKNLAGNQLPNAPPVTLSFGSQYTMPLTTDWAGTLRGDFYWQSDSFARVFNDRPYDQLRGYTNLNLTLIFTNQSGWQTMFYAKNVFNTTAITGTFLNSDDTDLTTNVFVTDPRLVGIRITKNW